MEQKDLPQDHAQFMQNDEAHRALLDTLNNIATLNADHRPPLRCYMSYAWPIRDQQQAEQWIQPFLLNLYQHLKVAGLTPILDLKDYQKENTLEEFIRQANEAEWILLFGTPSLLSKHKDLTTHPEKVDLSIMLKTQNLDSHTDQQRVLPILLMESEQQCFPEHMQFTFASNWTDVSYATNLMNLITHIYYGNHPTEKYNTCWQVFFDRNLHINQPLDSEELKHDYAKKMESIKYSESYQQARRARLPGYSQYIVSQRERQTQPLTVDKFNGLFQLDDFFEHFIGREKILARMAQSIATHSVCLSGSGGIGKTLLATIFSYRTYKLPQRGSQKGYASVVWLSGGADTPQNTRELIKGQLLHLAPELGLDTAHDLEDQLLYQKIFTQLESRGPCLCVFDNVHDLASIRDYLPPEKPQFHVLVTTRNTYQGDWGEDFAHFSVPVFSRKEANRYIANALRCKEDDSMVTRLADTLGRFPLSLAQGVDYMINHNKSLPSFLKLFNTRSIDLLKIEPGASNPYKREKNNTNARSARPATIVATIQLALEQIKQPEAIQLLEICACLASETAISLNFLTHWFTDYDRCREVAIECQRYGLLDIADSPNQVRIHDMVQFIIKSKQDNAALGKWLLQVAKVMCDESEVQQYYLLPHLEVVKAQLQNHPVCKHSEDAALLVSQLQSLIQKLKRSSGFFDHRDQPNASQRNDDFHSLHSFARKPNQGGHSWK